MTYKWISAIPGNAGITEICIDYGFSTPYITPLLSPLLFPHGRYRIGGGHAGGGDSGVDGVDGVDGGGVAGACLMLV